MLTKWETLFLLLLAIPIMGHVTILPLMIDVAGRDVWISIAISIPFGVLFAFFIYRIKVHYSEKTLSHILIDILGKPLGYGFIGFFVLYFLYLTILSYSSLIDFVFILFLPETPRTALIIWFLPLILYGAKKGIKSIALAAGILTFITMATGHGITLLDSLLKDWGNLKPILEDGWDPAIIGTLIITSIWIELIFLLALPLKDVKQKRVFVLWTVGVLLNALMMLSTTTGVITIFGLGQAENMLYPAQEIVRIISLGFLDRFDVYGMILNTFGTFIRCSLYFRLAYSLSSSKQSKKGYKRFIYIFYVVIIVLGTFGITRDHIYVEKTIDIYAHFVFLYPIPFILWLILKIKNMKNRDKSKGKGKGKGKKDQSKVPQSS